MAVTLCELKWLSQLLCDLRVSVPRPIPLTMIVKLLFTISTVKQVGPDWPVSNPHLNGPVSFLWVKIV